MRRTTSISSTASSTSCLLLLAALLLAVWPATAQQYGKNKVQPRNLQWRVLTTPHFDLHFHDGAEELAVRAAIIVERAYKEYADRLDRDLPFRVPFILYSSHAQFAQTNIADYLIGEGTGGFSEPFRNRIVLPYNGSHADFVHVIRHELVHVFMFDMAFGARSGTYGRNSFFRIPLWFAEGVAEWLSSGWDANADMMIRDATISDYLQPLEYVGGYMVYKQGQAAMRLLSDRYGPEKLNEFWRAVGRYRSVEYALKRTYGLTMEELNRHYAHELRRRYWPGYSNLEQLSDIARPLSDGTAFDGRPSLNPDGDLAVCFTNREGLLDLYLLSAIDGRAIRRLGRSQRSTHFESFHSMKSGLGWSPDGKEIILVARSHNRETLHTIGVDHGQVTRSWDLGLDVAANPSWSPDGRLVALVGTTRGRTDLYLLEMVPGALDSLDVVGAGPVTTLPDGVRLMRLTDDAGDEGAPQWAPDSRRLVFTFNPLAEVEFEFEEFEDGRKRLLSATTVDTARIAPPPAVEILGLDGRRQRIFGPEDVRRDPVWVDNQTLTMVNGEDGLDNLAIVGLDSTGTTVTLDRRLTNVLGGVQNITYAPRSDRLVFSAFHRGGYSLYAADDFKASWSRREPGGEAPQPVVSEPPVLVTRAGVADTLRMDADRIGMVEDYHPRFRLDASRAGAGGSVYWTNAGGLGFANIISLTDDLGDRRLDFLINFYGAVDNSDLAMTYTYLKRRIDVSGGAFIFNNFYNSIMTSVGELLTDDTLFKETNYGFFGRASYPLSTFERWDLDVQFLNSDRTEYGYDLNGYLIPTGKFRNRLFQPTVGFTHDNALYGLHGPMAGSRYSLTFSYGIPISESSLNRYTFIGDLRKYWVPFRRNSLALHLTYAHSDGDDPRAFIIGGPWTLRGYNYRDYQTLDNLAGTKMALFSLEYRLPFVDYLIFGWPSQWGLTGIGGALFFDAGCAWTDRVNFFGDDEYGKWGMQDMRGDYGLGLRANVVGLPLKFDWARRTDLRRPDGWVFHFSIGADF